MIQRALMIAMLTISALVLVGANFALAKHDGGGSSNTFNITVNCSNGTQAHKQTHSSTSVSNVNINVTCSGGGGVGQPGPPGKNGNNATITLCDVNSTNPVCNAPARH